MPDDASSNNDPDRDLAAALHEVGNCLTVVLGWLEEAQARAKGGTVAVAVDAALERAKRAHRIARRAIGAETTRPGVEPLATVVKQSVDGLAPVAAKKRISMRSAVGPGLDGCGIEAGERLLQVLTNLLLNALEVTPEGGEIRVAVEDGTEGSGVRFAVEDGGPGIPEGDRTKIFQRGVTTRDGGAGIGLAHAMSIANEEGGSLSVRPYESGRGATFELFWPRSVTSSRSGPMTRRVAPLGDMSIAVVDDDRGVLELLDMVFTARGASVKCFSRHADFVEALGGSTFDVALLDASPYGAGLEEALRSLKDGNPSLDLVLISGAADPGVSVGKLGVTWIRKPFEVDEVINVVRLVKASSRSDT